MNFDAWYTENVGITPDAATRRGTWDIDLLRKCFSDAVAAERERWMVAATAAAQELCHCAPWTAGGQAFAALRQLIEGPNVPVEPDTTARKEA